MLSHLATVAECVTRDAMLNAASTANSASSVNSSNTGPHNDGAAVAPYVWIMCILGYVNSLTNGFSLAVFILDKKNVIMRRLLLLLSLSETVFNICLAVNCTVMLAVAARPSVSDSLGAPNLITGVSFLSFMLFNAYIMIRNWCLVMIAGSRCEVVRNPLSTRSGQLFSPSRTLAGYICLSLLSLLICAPRLFEFTWIVYPVPCNSSFSNESSAYLLTTNSYPILDALPNFGFYYKTLVLYSMQTVLPIFLISGLSFVIIFTLRRRQFQHQPGSLGGGSAARSQDAATKTVMVLLTCFVMFELPTFLFYVLNRTRFKSLANYSKVRTHTTFIANILVCLDSFSNFIVYSSTSNTFRETVRRVLRLPGSTKSSAAASAAAAAAASGNYTMLRSANANAAAVNLSWSAANSAAAHNLRAVPGSSGGRFDSSLVPPTTAPPPPPQQQLSATVVDDEDAGFV